MRTGDQPGDEQGFTLVELLVAMMLSLIVTFAVLNSLDLFARHSAHQTVVLDGNDQVRALMDRTVRDLQGASAVVSAQPQDLIYTVPSASGTLTRRLCVTSGTLYGFSTAGVLTTATPCASGTRYATLATAAATGFTYDGATASTAPQTVVNVGLSFALNTTSHRRTGTTVLQASASRRVGPELIDPSQLLTKCDSTGAVVSLTPLGSSGPVTITYTDGLGNPLGTSTGAAVHIPSSVTKLVANVTNAAGVTTSVSQDVKCGS